MSLPPELRVLCHLLSSTPTTQLPRITPVLLRNVVCCQVPLSIAENHPGKSEASESAVLVHKLKTQISSLLYGKNAEGRFVAAGLIKAVVETGGWEVLRGVEYWVKGLLAVLGKPDSVGTKRICILALTKIYLMTHQYQSLVREITTPTLPTFVLSCLSLVSGKHPKVLNAPSSLTQTVFDAFSALIPNHPAIFRPFTNQIRSITRQYLAPTLCDRRFVPLSLSRSARRLHVLIYQTAPKNSSGEEWGKGIRELVKEIHSTTDHVYRAVIEDWESTAGYHSQPVDVNQELCGGGKSDDDLPAWAGVDAGLERLIGLLGLLEELFKYSTPTAVTIPLGVVVDLLTRLLSIAPPPVQKKATDHGITRINPSIERNEREGLWAGLPSVHVASLQVYGILSDRLQQNFASLAHVCLDQITWLFASGSQDEAFRTVTYRTISKVLPLIGSSLSKSTIVALTPICRSCASEVTPVLEVIKPSGVEIEGSGKSAAVASNKTSGRTDGKAVGSEGSKVFIAASELLPLLLSHIPQQYLREQHRAELDRASILSNNLDAMVASVLNPFTKKNGGSFPSILPHLCQSFPGSATVETLLRPRARVIHTKSFLSEHDPADDELDMDDQMDDVVVESLEIGAGESLFVSETSRIIREEAPIEKPPKPINLWDQKAQSQTIFAPEASEDIVMTHAAEIVSSISHQGESDRGLHPEKMPATMPATEQDDDDDSDHSSVHLTMDLSDSEDSSPE